MVTPERGDLVWVTIEPGHGGAPVRRPALVVSPSLYNERAGLALMCAIGSHAKGYPFEVALPAGLAVDRPEATLEASARLSRSYRVNLEVLALVALFTGGLLVFSTQALAVVRRRAQLALLRVLGVTRRRLVVLIVAEAALVGVAGSVLGLGAGYALAHAALRWVGVDLGSGYFRGVTPTLTVDAASLAAFFALGVAAAVLGALLPALETARAAPAPALKAGDQPKALAPGFAGARPGWRGLGPGVAIAGLGAAATTLPPIAGLPVFGYVAIALLLIGTLLLMPRLAVAALAAAPNPGAVPAQLALAQLRSAPGQVAVSLATIVASVSHWPGASQSIGPSPAAPRAALA